MKSYALNISLLIVLLLSLNLFSQRTQPARNPATIFKTEGIRLMQLGKYGEAIDQLNRYVSAVPKDAEGFNLRGLCYEKRNQLEIAVLDLRTAAKLAPNNREIAANLARVTKTWYDQLYLKIEGHRREIAINPNNGFNYLEIGKCYKNLGQWLLAEQWYDEFLKREEASADEIIRYTEILARNNHIQKGEPILKRYTEKYPLDWRIWSRYGYFTFWLGKRKIAQEAFEEALRLRPFFKEAMDGLDLVLGKGYQYTFFDTTQRRLHDQPKRQPRAPEFPIDRFYRILKNSPDDHPTRYLLIDELMKFNRIEEAFLQVRILEQKDYDNPNFQVVYDTVNNVRNRIIAEQEAKYEEEFERNPANKVAALSLSENYARQYDYDMAIQILQKYFEAAPNEKNDDVRFRLAQYSAWNKNWDISLEQLTILLQKDPNNIEYQFLRGQLAVWTQTDLDLADTYLNNYYSLNPNNLAVIVSLASLAMQKQDFDKATEFANKGFAIDSLDQAITQIYSSIEFQKLRAEQDRVFQILLDARNLYYEGRFAEAIPLYESYMAQSESNVLLKKEFADVNFFAGNFDRAQELYTEVLADSYDFDTDLMRARVYFSKGDSLKALEEFERLKADQPENFDVKIAVSDALMKLQRWSDAREYLDNMLETTTDTAQIAIIQQRIGWLGPGFTFGSIFTSFPNFIGLSPFFYTYSDNLNLNVTTYGGRTEFGITTFLTGGFSFFRTNYTSPGTVSEFTSFKFNVFVRLTDRLSIGGGLGKFNTRNNVRTDIVDGFIRYEIPNQLTASVAFEQTDALSIYISPFLINRRIGVNILRFNASYNNPAGLKAVAAYNFYSLTDQNVGNDLFFRIGRRFYEQVNIGYEYYYATYRFVPVFTDFNGILRQYYFAPQRFDSHSLWGEYMLEKQQEYNIEIGGKIGYIPLGDAILNEGYIQANYLPMPTLTITGRIGFGSSFRFDYRYQSFSALISAYLTL